MRGVYSAPMQFETTSDFRALSEELFRAAARRSLHPDPPAEHAVIGARAPSDFDLNPEAAPDAETAPAPRPAAVLVPVVRRPELSLLFTQRTDHLPSHAGQIAFPGGKMEDFDA